MHYNCDVSSLKSHLKENEKNKLQTGEDIATHIIEKELLQINTPSKEKKNGQKTFYILIWLCFQMTISNPFACLFTCHLLPCFPQLVFWKKKKKKVKIGTLKKNHRRPGSLPYLCVYPHPVHYFFRSAADLRHSHHMTFILRLLITWSTWELLLIVFPRHDSYKHISFLCW